MLELNAILEIVKPGLKTILPALVIALVGHHFLLRWQHDYWTLRKLVKLQGNTYRDARDLLVRMIHVNEELIMGPLTAQGGTATRLHQERLQILKDRIALARLSSEVPRLFSPRADAAMGDAVHTLLGYYYRAVRLLLNPQQAPLQVDAAGAMLALRAEATVKIQWALSLLAADIGRRPGKRWQHRIWSPPKFGRRCDDLRDLGRLPPGEEAPGKRKRHNRRVTDRLSDMDFTPFLEFQQGVEDEASDGD